ncbi:MAG: lysine--tRNA ligase [Propionibacteriaceae bacterium]|nr:lysine--tRNA ligase [Propionibacteriaceae bacterium]
MRAIDEPPAPDQGAWLAKAGDQVRHRTAHLTQLQSFGGSGYPVGQRDAVMLSELEDPLRDLGGRAVVGRVRAVRDHGGVILIELTDGAATVQCVLEEERAGGQAADFAHFVDRGDLIEIHAVPGESRTGTPSLLVDSWTMLAKALRPIPWGGVADPQARARDRSLDLIVHSDQADLLRARSRVIAAVRAELVGDGYMEVETPILNVVHGGASARPFRTHINAYDMDLVLRIAPELALKRLLVGGLGPIFEIGRNFRNEGADSSHNPEFTVVEAYRPLADYHEMRRLTQRIIQRAASAVHGRPLMPLGPDGELTDISGEWPVVPVCDAVSAAVGTRVTMDMDLDALLALAQEHGVAVRDGWGAGAVVEELYGELVEARTVEPTFYVDFPAETSPLTAPHRSAPGLVERWDLVAGGMELGTAYSELTDPLIQRQRLVEQSWKAALGDPEAMEVDEDFLAALELGMPPAGGLGIGLDRLVMALTGASIRQVLSFPFVRPRIGS